MKALILPFCIFLLNSVSYGQDRKIPDSCLFVPNTLSRDCENFEGDYKLKVYSQCLIEDYLITIYNRWAEVIYTSNDIEEMWDAEEVPEGTYIWQITGRIWDNGTPFQAEASGNIVVLR